MSGQLRSRVLQAWITLLYQASSLQFALDFMLTHTSTVLVVTIACKLMQLLKTTLLNQAQATARSSTTVR